MRGRRTRILGLLGAAAVSAGGATAILPAAAAAAPANRDVTKLFGPARAKVRGTRTPLFARAKVYEADGYTADGRATNSAAGIIRWRFAFDNYPSKSKYASALVAWSRDHGFGPVRGYKSPFTEDLVIASAPKMTLATAVAKLRAAGIHRSFVTVTLRRPLLRHKANTLYYFELSNQRNVSVDTVTGKVRKVAG
jgi:hypothetical protein